MVGIPLLLAVLEKRGGIKTSTCDAYLNIIGGLMLDEPAAGMNPQETQELADYIQEIRDTHNLTIFLIEHHMDLVMKISDYIYVIDFGSEIARGVPREVQQNKRVIEAYLGVTEDE